MRGVFRRVAVLAGVLLAACGGGRDAVWNGYVEGEFVYLAAPQAGYLKTLDAARGARVAAGEQVFALASDPDAQALASAEARVEAARSRVDNLSEPRRPPEISALEAQVHAAETALRLATTQLAQQEALAASRFISQARLDEARAARDGEAARLDAARQQLATYRASFGRKAEVAGARAELEAAGAEAELREWQLARKTVAAPAAGEIAETYFEPGEWVGAGQPVASLLPDGRRRVRFYVPEREVAGLAPGMAVTVRCDGCGEAFEARIDFVAPEAEYTPPVIYSEKARAKLVFRVEAVPAPALAAILRPGVPVDVVAAGN
ncbi:HlyD family secretion protein [Aromatoleum sp.]|uniref:HlyD family secretion protein n=1 Tax=Aromatoleum sp. TaxID=2307007 RepID=UPI002FCB8E27